MEGREGGQELLRVLPAPYVHLIANAFLVGIQLDACLRERS